MWFVGLFLTANVWAQTSVFLYQGRLNDNNNPANGTYEMQFKLFDALAGGSQIGATQTSQGVSVANGVFGVSLDFGANAFTGANRFLEVSVRRNTGEQFVVLAPRTQILTAPYSIRSNSAATADTSTNATTANNALNLGGIAASEYVTTSTVGSSFIRNSTTLQTGNFNISGSGLVGGNLGIGTTSPGYRLDVFGLIRAFGSTSNDMLVQTGGGTNAWARFSMQTPSQIWAIGTSQNFNGNQFYLFDTSNQQSRMTVQPAGGAISFPVGNVGIGITNPTAKLELSGTGFGAGQRITDQASGNSLVLQSGVQNNMKVTGYNYNTGQAVPLYLSVDGAFTNVGGNLTQVRSSGGAVKAMVYVNGDGAMLRCYNGITGASIGSCGFNVIRETSGNYTVDFNFQVTDRFLNVSVQNYNNLGINPDAGVSFTFSGNFNDLIVVNTYQVGSGPSDRPFMIIVY